MKPVILVTCSYEAGADEASNKQIINLNYVRSMQNQGALPLLLPYGATDEDLDIYLAMCQGVLLTGGPDVAPAMYGEEVKYNTVEVVAVRDDLEMRLYAKAKAAGKPIMGICRGQQLMNVLEGGKLYQDLPVDKSVIHTKTYHGMELAPNTFCSKLFGEHVTINSYHHQGIRELAPDFYILGRDGDIVEGIAHKTLPIFAVQFHPERQMGEGRPENTTDMNPLFAYFLSLVCA